MIGIPPAIIERYLGAAHEIDMAMILDAFRADPGAKVLVVGCHDEPTSLMMAEAGFQVTGLDLRPWDRKLPPCNFRFIQGDLCELPADLVCEFTGAFDVFVALSAIEHCGLAAYQGDVFNRYYDVIAMRRAWEFLRPGGRAFITVPFGSHYLEILPHWRVYDFPSARDRLVQQFAILAINAVSCGGVWVDGHLYPMGERIGLNEAMRFPGVPPHVSTLFYLEKVETRRRS